jgi:hypothetical protein
MLQQEKTYGFDLPQTDFDPARAPLVPTTKQVIEPGAVGFDVGRRWRLAAEVFGNVLVGSALLAGLLSAPGLIGGLLGIV